MEEYKNWVYKILGIIFLIYICGECAAHYSLMENWIKLMCK